MKIAIHCAIGLAMIGAVGTANAAGPASGRMQITLTVPKVCNIDTLGFTADPQAGGQAIGTVREFCNSSDGFMVMASHRQLMPGEQVRVIYDGEVSDLTAAGISPVAFRAGPRLRTVPVAIQSNGLQTPISVSLGMTAL